MNNNTTYKDSPLGKIPRDWEVKSLVDIFQITAGGDIEKKNVSEVKNEIFQFPIYANASRNKGLYAYSDIYKIDFDCLTITGRGEIGGAIARFEKFYPIVRLLILRPRFEVNLVFFENSVNNSNIHQESTGVPQLTAPQVSKLKLPLPPLPEQTRIAEVLSTWDKAIENLKQTIELAQQRKKGLMQQLLTGKKRLKGFSGEWKIIHIHEVAKEVSIRNKTDKQLKVLSCTKYNGLVDSLEYWGRQIFAEDISTYKIVPKNHFAYATNHIEEGSIGYQGDYDEALISPMYTVFKTDKSVNDDFFYKLLKSHLLIYQYNARMEGSIDRRGGLRWDAFSIIKINLPSFEEQTAIAKVLQTADLELEILKGKLDRLREQKKGLMQVLLTGKKRLKIV